MDDEPNDYFDATPRADALIEGLRDFGYTLETALADVVDNSITASATEIQIFAEFNEGSPCITISDNGIGMNRETLHEVMRPGGRIATAQKGAIDLGRFGLGMKTAAFSQCTQLTVTSYIKASPSSAQWDLKQVAASNKWRAKIPKHEHLTERARESRDHGTVVVWEDLDRLVEGEGAEVQQQDFNKKLVSARSHLELVLHRFLQREREHKVIKISFNNVPLIPNDPFLPNHPATIKQPIEKIQYHDGTIQVRAYTLPHHSKMSTADWEAAGGVRGHTATQGFYLYRARRLIVHGTWFGMHRKSASSQLTRIAIDIPTTMDTEWQVNVLKASARPPLEIRERLNSLVPSLSNVSNRVYQNRGTALTDNTKNPLWVRNAVHEGISYTINTEHPYIRSYLQSLAPKERKHTQQLLRVIQSGVPLDSLFIDLSNSPTSTHAAHLDTATLTELVTVMAATNQEQGFTWAEIHLLLQTIEPFKTQWDDVKDILESLPKTGSK